MRAMRMRAMPMARMGRPKNPDGSGDIYARPVRLPKDLAYMIGWICDLHKPRPGEPKLTAAALIAPLIRGPIEARYAIIKPQVEKIKKARKEAEEKTDVQEG